MYKAKERRGDFRVDYRMVAAPWFQLIEYFSLLKYGELKR